MSFPSGYKQLEYIQSNGAQYVNTNLLPNQDSRIVLDVLFTNEKEGVLFGSRTSPTANNFSFLNTGSLKYRADYNNTQVTLSAQKSSRFILDMNKNVLLFDGETVHTFTYVSFQGAYPLYLFVLNSAGSNASYATATLYSCQIYDNGTLIRDYIPCKTTDGEIGLWDDVNSEFYGNAGTGTFTAGPVVDPYGNDENTLLLLHGEDLTDSSPKGVAITNNGVSVSDAQSKFGGKSLYFSGSVCLLLPNNAFEFKDANFTIDWWEYCTGSSGMTRFGALYDVDGAYGMSVGYGGTDVYLSKTAGSWDMLAATGNAMSVTLNTWVHWAVVRNGTSLKIFRNGSKFFEAAISGSLSKSATSRFSIGAHSVGNFKGFNGYIDEFRISNISRWTEDFTPPTEPYSSPIPPTPSNFRLSSNTETTATLSWDAVDGATGYKLYRDGALISTLTDTSYTDGIHPFTPYVYTLTAYNDNGESDPATISVQIIIPPEAPSNFRVFSTGMTQISMAWDTVTGADIYQLKRNGSVIYSGDGTSYTDGGLTSETAYTYTLSAVNSAGSSAETTLEATTTQLILVTDRTAADVAAQNAKGTYNAADLNRVGEAMNYVADRLRSAGYDPHISPKTDWKENDWPTPQTMERYLGALAELWGQFSVMKITPTVPKDMVNLTYQDANDIERILEDVDALITNIIAGWFYSGELYSGEV